MHRSSPKDLLIGVIAIVLTPLILLDNCTHILGDAFEPCSKSRCYRDEVMAWHKKRGTEPSKETQEMMR